MNQEVNAQDVSVNADELWNQVEKDRSTIADDQDTQSIAKDEVKTDEQVNEAPKAKPEVTNSDDPLSSLPEPTRKLIEQIQAKSAEQDKLLREAGQKLATAHGTIGNLNQKLDESLRTLNQVKPMLDAVTEKEAAKEKAELDAKAAENAEKRRALRENLEGTDVAEYLDMVLADVKPKEEPAKPIQTEAKPEVPPQVQPQTSAEADEIKAKFQQLESERARLEIERDLSDLHPGWKKTVGSTEYDAWTKLQTTEIQQKINNASTVGEADKYLTQFKKHQEDAAKVAQVEAERQARLRRNEVVDGHGTAARGESDDPNDLWEKVQRDRQKARAA
jgi:hypothetical protein